MGGGAWYVLKLVSGLISRAVLPTAGALVKALKLADGRLEFP